MRLNPKKLRKLIKEEMRRYIKENDFNFSSNGGLNTNGRSVSKNGKNGQERNLRDAFARFSPSEFKSIGKALNYFGKKDPTSPNFIARPKADAMSKESEDKVPHFSLELIKNAKKFEAFVGKSEESYHGFVYSNGTTPKEAARGKKALGSGKTSEDEPDLIAGAIVVGLAQAIGHDF